MLTTILLGILTLINLGALVVFYLNTKKNNEILGKSKFHLDSLEQTQQQIQFLQNKFKESLERIIASDSQVIDATSRDILRHYQGTQQALLENFNQNSQRLIEALNGELTKRVGQLSLYTEKQAEDVKKILIEELKKDIKDVDKRIEAYADQRYKEVDERILKVIEETIKDTAGKVINMVDHQDLVMSALEKAKGDNFFS